MDVDIAKVRSLQERETATFYKQRTENENKIAKIADAIKRYPDIGEKIGVLDYNEFSYQKMVPEAYKPVAEIDKPTLREQTDKLQTYIVKYNQIVLEEYEKAVKLQEQADTIVGIGG